MNKIGVIGAGVMGRGIAQDLAQTGHEVVLVDISDDILLSAKKEIHQTVRFNSFLNKTEGNINPDEVVAKINFTKDYQALSDVDFLIENAVEKWEVKEPIYKLIDEVCREDVVFAVNTSAISITRVGGITNRPDKVVGMHFMNPVPMKRTVEVIRGYHTSEESIQTAKDFLGGLDKKAVVVNDMPGFVSNRVLMLTVNEAIFLVQDQVAEPGDIDTIFKECFGHKMGPLETADLIGLDTILYSLDVLYDSYDDSKYRPCPLLKKMVSAKLFGRKNGQGFYKYPEPF